MASSALQLLGFFLSLGGLAATIAATFMVTWKKRLEGLQSSVLQTHHEGLWMTCSGYNNNRETSCTLRESLFDLPSKYILMSDPVFTLEVDIF